MTTSTRLYRVRFCEWQAFATDIEAANPDDAIAAAQAVRETQGTLPFQEIDGGSDNWDAEEADFYENVLPLLRRALRALNTAPRFRVGNADSNFIAAQLDGVIRNLEGGAS
jgi:hypothetical protein